MTYTCEYGYLFIELPVVVTSESIGQLRVGDLYTYIQRKLGIPIGPLRFHTGLELYSLVAGACTVTCIVLLWVGVLEKPQGIGVQQCNFQSSTGIQTSMHLLSEHDFDLSQWWYLMYLGTVINWSINRSTEPAIKIGTML